MKVKFTEDAKKFITVSELPAVKRIIAEMKEDGEIKGYSEIAARVASGYNGNFEILKAEAEISRNGRVNDAYGEGSGKLDIWLNVYAFDNYAGFFEIGAYLTDIWAVAGDNAEEIRSHMYINKYSREK